MTPAAPWPAVLGDYAADDARATIAIVAALDGLAPPPRPKLPRCRRIRR